MNPPKWDYKFSPQWAPHVTGFWNTPVTDSETKALEPIPFFCLCDICKGTYQNICTTGSVKSRITKFAFAHYHKADPNQSKETPK